MAEGKEKVKRMKSEFQKNMPGVPLQVLQVGPQPSPEHSSRARRAQG